MLEPRSVGGAREVSSEIETTTGVAAVTWTRHKFNGLKHFKLHLSGGLLEPRSLGGARKFPANRQLLELL